MTVSCPSALAAATRSSIGSADAAAAQTDTAPVDRAAAPARPAALSASRRLIGRRPAAGSTLAVSVDPCFMVRFLRWPAIVIAVLKVGANRLVRDVLTMAYWGRESHPRAAQERFLPSPLVGEGGLAKRGRMRGAPAWRYACIAAASFLPTPLIRLGAARRSTFSHKGRREVRAKSVTACPYVRDAEQRGDDGDALGGVGAVCSARRRRWS